MTTQKILEVQAVKLLVGGKSCTLTIVASGTVPTSGWSNPQLIPYVYIMPPQDGIWDFDFVAEAPTDISLPVVSPVEARYQWDSVPTGIQGVRVHASSNSRVALLEKSPVICVKGVLTEEGVECQALRSTTGELYTLVGDLSGFTNGEEVYVCGTIAQASFCMQGTTLVVLWIGKQVPLAAQPAPQIT